MSNSGQRLAHLKETVLLALPVSFGMIGHVITSWADTVMLGQYDKNHLSASTFAFNVFVTPMVIAMAFSSGITPLIANAVGEKNAKKIRELFRDGFLLYPLSGVVFFGLLYLGRDALFHMGQDPDIAILSLPYYDLLSLSIIPLFIFQLFKQFAEGLSNTILAMIASLSGNVVNIILNYIFINGKLGCEAMGIVGAGYATLIARVFMCVLVILLITRKRKFRLYFVFKSFKGWKKSVLSLFKFSFPIGIQVGLEVGAFAFSAIMIGWLGKDFLTIHTIAITTASTTFLMTSGVAAACTVRIGQFLGQNNINELKIAARTGIILVILMEIVFALLLYFTNDLIPLLFVESTEHLVLFHATELLLIAAIFQIPDGIQITFLGILRGLKDVLFSTYLTIVAYWILGVGSSWLLAFKFGLGIEGIWIGFIIGLSSASLLLFLRYRYVVKRLSSQ